MHSAKTTQFLALTVALAVISASQALGALVVADAGRGSADASLLSSQLTQLLYAEVSGGQLSSLLHGACGPMVPDDEDHPPQFEAKGFVPLSGMSVPVSSSTSGPSGSSTAAVLEPVCYVPDVSLHGPLARDSALLIPAVSPFELLRPA